MQEHKFLRRFLAGILATLTVALFAAPANAAAGTWNASNTTTGEVSSYSYLGTATQDATPQSLKATVPAGTTSAGAKGVHFNGRGGIATVDAPGQASNSMEMVIRLRMDDWTPSANQMILSKWNNVNGERAWALQVNTDGTVTWRIGNTNTGVYNMSPTSPLGFADGSTQWLKISYYIQVGNDTRYLNITTSADGVNWGAPMASANQGNARQMLTTSPAPIRMGQGDSSLGTSSLRGAVYYARLTDNIAPNVFALFNGSEYVPGATTWTSGSTTWTSNTFSSLNGTTAGADLGVGSVSGVAANGRAYLALNASELLYQHAPDRVVTSGTPVTLTVTGVTNTTSPGTYSSVFTTQTAAAVIDTFNTNSNMFISPAGVNFAVELAPIFSFTVAPRLTECSLQSGLIDSTFVAPASTSSANLGAISPGSIRSTAFDLSTATNAAGGVLVTVKGALPNNNMRSTTAQPFADASSAPLISSATFGYTVSNTHIELNASWKALSDLPAEVAYSSSLGFTNQCVGHSLAVSGSVPPGAYNAVVTYTAVPTF